MIGVVDVAHGLLVDGVWASRLLLVAGVDPYAVEAEFETKTPGFFSEPSNPKDFTKAARKAIARAKKLAATLGHENITSSHLFVACLSVEDETVRTIMEGRDLELDELTGLVASGC